MLVCRDGAVVRALASHQCGLGSIPGPNAISGLSFCWFSSLLRGFFSGFSGFPSSAKTSIPLIPVGCAPRSHMDRIAAARGAIVCFRFDLVELHRCCTLRRRLATAIIVVVVLLLLSSSSSSSSSSLLLLLLLLLLLYQGINGKLSFCNKLSFFTFAQYNRVQLRF